MNWGVRCKDREQLLQFLRQVRHEQLRQFLNKATESTNLGVL